MPWRRRFFASYTCAFPASSAAQSTRSGAHTTTLDELTLTLVQGGTLLSFVITYADAEQREAILEAGMTGGIETSHVRLGALLEKRVTTAPRA